MKKFVSIILILISGYVYAEGKYQTAVFAGGCFWCLESDFDYFKQHQNLSHGGIISVESGYDGGQISDPNYKLVSSGTTNYKEVIQVIFDPQKVDYTELVEYFYRRVNPTDNAGQFCDKGKQYQSAIYYTSPKQKQIAEQVTKKLKDEFKFHNQNVYTTILPSTTFYPAEDYHQEYYIKNPKRYCFYRTSCGRDQTVNKVWQGVEWKYNDIVPFNTPESKWECLNRRNNH